MSNFTKNLKAIGKKGKDFVKSISVDTISAIKADIAEKRARNKAFDEWYNTVYKASSDKSE